VEDEQVDQAALSKELEEKKRKEEIEREKQRLIEE